MDKREEIYETFSDWFNEAEGYALRSERFDGDVEWLKAAFEAGQSALSQARSQAYEECAKIAEMHEGAYEMDGIISVAIREAASNPHSEKVE